MVSVIRSVEAALRRFWRWISFPVWWPLGLDLAWNTDKPDRAGSEIAALFGVFLVNTATLAIVEQKTEVHKNVLIGLYVFIAVMVFGAISCLLRSKANPKPNQENAQLPPMHSYDRGTIMMGRWIVCWGTPLTLAVAISTWKGAFGQSTFEPAPDVFKVRVPVKKFERFEADSISVGAAGAKKNLPVIKAVLIVRAADFEGGRIPRDMDLEINLKGEFASKWTVRDMTQFRIRDNERTEDKENGPSEVEAKEKPSKDVYKSRWSLHRLKPTDEYELNVYFATSGPAPEKEVPLALKVGFQDACTASYLLAGKKQSTGWNRPCGSSGSLPVWFWFFSHPERQPM